MSIQSSPEISSIIKPPRQQSFELDSDQLCNTNSSNNTLLMPDINNNQSITERVALIIVDVQNDFVTGSLAVPDAESIISIVNSIRQQYTFDCIILSRDYHPRNHISFVTQHAGKKLYESITLPNGDQQGMLKRIASQLYLLYYTNIQLTFLYSIHSHVARTLCTKYIWQ